MKAEIIINRSAKKLNRTFDYNIPQELEELVMIGSTVLVPFGKTAKGKEADLEEGYVVNIKEKTTPDIPVYETDNSSEIKISDIPFKIGDKVYHPKHGYGVIEGFANYSNKILFCQIEFENVGRRILDPRISGIEKVS